MDPSGYEPLARAVRDRRARGAPFVVGIAGGVAVGKTTAAGLLRDALSDLDVAIVATDGFLLPNVELAARGAAMHKGWPESYDADRLARVIAEVKAGAPAVAVPVYSHDTYDVVPGVTVAVRAPDVLVVEGLHVLRPDHGGEMLDLGVYLHAEEHVLQEWYVRRFVELCADAAGSERRSFYAQLAGLSPEDAEALAREVWRAVNLANLRDHVLPTRSRADMVVEKESDHSVQRVVVQSPARP